LSAAAALKSQDITISKVDGQELKFKLGNASGKDIQNKLGSGYKTWSPSISEENGEPVMSFKPLRSTQDLEHFSSEAPSKKPIPKDGAPASISDA